jgi:CDP-diglyceride synthetase
MKWGPWLLQIVVFAAVILVVYNVLKIYLFPKVKVNKWIVLALGIVTFFLPSVLASVTGNTFAEDSWFMLGTSGLFMIFFLWFMDLSGFSRKGKTSTKNNKTSVSGFERKKGEKDIVIKPKAKPNRVKNKNS